MHPTNDTIGVKYRHKTTISLTSPIPKPEIFRNEKVTKNIKTMNVIAKDAI